MDWKVGVYWYLFSNHSVSRLRGSKSLASFRALTKERHSSKYLYQNPFHQQVLQACRRCIPIRPATCAASGICSPSRPALGLRSGFEPPYLERPGKQLHQEGLRLIETRLAA